MALSIGVSNGTQPGDDAHNMDEVGRIVSGCATLSHTLATMGSSERSTLAIHGYLLGNNELLELGPQYTDNYDVADPLMAFEMAEDADESVSALSLSLSLNLISTTPTPK